MTDSSDNPRIWKRSDGAVSPALGPMRVLTLSDQCYQQLHDAIIALELKPGTPLAEQQLADRFRISKSPVREALQRLSRDGLVTLAPNRRAVVTGIEVADVRDWYELRLVLEPASLRRAADLITPTTLDVLASLAEAAVNAVERHDTLAFIHNSDAFHLTLIDLNPNKSLVAVVHDLFSKIRRVRIAQYQEDSLKERQSLTLEGLHHHHAIVAALECDIGRAIELLEQDIQAFIDLLDAGEVSDALKRVTFEKGRDDRSPP